MSDDNAKVVRAFPAREIPNCPVTLERKTSYCRHPRIVLNEHDRTVICADCAATLDPFDYLRNGAVALLNGWQDHKQVTHQLREMREQIEALSKQRRLLIGQIRRMKEKNKAGGQVLDMRGDPS